MSLGQSQELQKIIMRFILYNHSRIGFRRGDFLSENIVTATEHKIGNIIYTVKSQPSESTAQTLDELIESLIVTELDKSN